MFLPKFKWLRRLSWLIGLLITLGLWSLILLVAGWAAGRWHDHKQGEAPFSWGVVWSDKQAEALGLDANADLDLLLAEIPFKRLQLTAYWDRIEQQPGNYDFDPIRQRLAIAKSRNLQVSLQLGLHQSRWPRCHAPKWSWRLSETDFKDALKRFISETIARLDNEINLVQYQLEPEIFKADDQCPKRLNPQDLTELHALIGESTDKDIVLSRPNNWINWRKQQPASAIFGLCLDPGDWAFRRPPSRYYAALAGNLKILHPESRVVIRALTAEPGYLGGNPDNWNPQIDDFTAGDLEDMLFFGRQTNIRTIDLMGAEWWLQQKRLGRNAWWQAVHKIVADDF